MLVKIKPLFYITLLCSLLLPMQAYAISFADGQFDQFIQKAEIVIKAQVVPQNDAPFEMIAFKAEVISILKSDGKPIPENLSLKSTFPVWPKDLGVPFEKGQVVLLVLRRAEGKLAVVNHKKAITPATKSKIDHKRGSSIRRKVFDELHAFLPQAKGEVSQALVLVHLSQLASKTDEKIFLPYAKSKDKWLRRAALASLLRINPTAKRIQAAVADFENHLSKPSNNNFSITSDDYLFWEMYIDLKWVSRCGAWGMEKDMTERATTYLPIYRTLIDKALRDYQRVYIGINALKNVGGREDIHRLYKHLNHNKAWIRHDVLEGLGRILKMKVKRPHILSYGMPESRAPHIEEWEKQTQATIEKALIEKGLLEKYATPPESSYTPSPWALGVKLKGSDSLNSCSDEKPAAAAKDDKSHATGDDVNSIDASQIETSLLPEKETFMLGEPIYFSFIVRNKSDQNLQVLVGGDYRNALGRPETFSISTVSEDGREVAQSKLNFSAGGLIGPQQIPAKGHYTFRLFLPNWATFQKVGRYTITAKRILKLSHCVPDRDWSINREGTEIPVRASTEISVIPMDKAKMGKLIVRLGKEILGKKDDEASMSARKLAAIDDERVVPHFLKALKECPYGMKFCALNALARFNNDQAFEGLKYGLRVEGKDFIERATTMEVANSLAINIKHTAIHAISKSPHPKAIPFLLSKRNDQMSEVRLTVVHKLGRMSANKAIPILQEMRDDKNELVRGEVRRYLKEFSSEEE